MGIKGLNKLLKDNTEKAVSEIDVKQLDGKVLAVDTSQVIYQYVLAIRGTGDDFKDKDGKITTHLHAILSKTITFVKNGIKPIYVFDGKPNKLKERLLKQRQDVKEKEEKKMKLAKTKQDKIKAHVKTFSITPDIVKDCKKLLDLLGIPYIQAPEEADPQCAALVKDKIADYGHTEDMDFSTFGTPFFIKTLRQSTKKVPKYNLKKILEELQITMNQYIDVCILLGCDYCTTIKGIGPKKALTLVKKYKNIEGIVNWIKKKKPTGYTVSTEFADTYVSARNYFIKPVILKKSEIEVDWTEPNILDVFKLLRMRGFNPITLKKMLTNYWNHWCTSLCEPKIKKKKLEKDIFPGIKFTSLEDSISDED